MNPGYAAFVPKLITTGYARIVPSGQGGKIRAKGSLPAVKIYLCKYYAKYLRKLRLLWLGTCKPHI
jgi:hypothetical protein